MTVNIFRLANEIGDTHLYQHITVDINIISRTKKTNHKSVFQTVHSIHDRTVADL